MISDKTFDQITSFKPAWFLLAGIVSLSVSNLAFGIDILGWISVVPFLLYLSLTRGFKSRLLFSVALVIAWSVAVTKIISGPIPWMMVFLYSIPISLVHLPAYILWGKISNSKWSVLVFPAVLGILEWIQYTFTPLASWGSGAYTQVNSPAVLQSVSIFGMAGLSFVIYWVNSSLARIILSRRITYLTFQMPALVVLGLVIFGSVRLQTGRSEGVQTLAVAAVGTDSEISGLPLPSLEINRKVFNDILTRTSTAASAGAKVVVWNEGAFYALPDTEQSMADTISKTAARENVTIVASYILVVNQEPLKYHNKYLMVDSLGRISFSYLKHQPVPGEPAIKGTEPFRTINVSGSQVSGSICYDYDFPYIARANAKAGADIVALPSSDWRGIDPLHTKMAALRAIEQGHSILRSTRFGLSAAITPYGEMTAQMSSYDHNNKVMHATLPVKGIKTLYGFIGDAFIYLCIGFLAWFLINVALTAGQKPH